MKKRHQYKITVEHIATPDGSPTDNKTVEFEVVSHDEVIGIIEKLKGRPDIGVDIAAPLALGIKLFGGVMLENKEHTLFSDIRPHFADFMKQLKKGSKEKA